MYIKSNQCWSQKTQLWLYAGCIPFPWQTPSPQAFPSEQIVQDKTVSQIMRRKSCFCIPPQVSSGIWLTWVGKGLAEASEAAGAVCRGAGRVAWLKLPTPACGHPQAAHQPQMGAGPGVLLARWAAGVEGTPCEGNLAGSQGTPRLPQGSPTSRFPGTAVHIKHQHQGEAEMLCHRERGVSSQPDWTARNASRMLWGNE